MISVIVPVFNEQATVHEVLQRVGAVQCDKQVVVVDDGSNDRTPDILRLWRDKIQLIRHERNRGKGMAIRTGLQYARGHFTIIQDADLEYDPQDYIPLLEPLLNGQAQVVYGSRYLWRNAAHSRTWNLFRIGVFFLNLLVRVIYGVRVTDEATCYKVFATPTLRAMDLQCEGFEFCSEVTSKACRMGLRIIEVPIHYYPRPISDGKKIRYRDGLSAIRALWKWRHWQPRPSAEGVQVLHSRAIELATGDEATMRAS